MVMEPEYAKSAISVWWNINRCPIPDDYDASRVSPRIDMVLMSLGYSGPLTIYAVGDFRDIPLELLRALSSTGIHLIEIACPSGALMEMVEWEELNQSPATMMFISDDLDLEAKSGPFRGLHNNGYNILLAYPHALPTKYVRNPQEPFGIVTSAQWLWDHFLKDDAIMDPQETRRTECSTKDLFLCSSCTCSFSSQSFEEFAGHLQSRDHTLKSFKPRYPKVLKRYSDKKENKQRKPRSRNKKKIVGASTSTSQSCQGVIYGVVHDGKKEIVLYGRAGEEEILRERC